MSSVAVLSVCKPINQTVEALCTSLCGGYSGDIGAGATAMGLHHMIANRTYNISFGGGARNRATFCAISNVKPPQLGQHCLQ